MMKRTANYLMLIACMTAGLGSMAQAQSVSFELWNTLLRKHVTADGKVDYKGFVKDSAQLRKCTELLKHHPPSSSWSRDERLAYWINAYNAFTVQLITRNYPVKSIRDIKGKTKAYDSPWDIPFIRIGEKKYTLNDIEHNIIRKTFHEPRIHFAVNCASKSCPDLRNQAYYGKTLQKQLDEQAGKFINDTGKNLITASSARLSEIFSWYKDDFTASGQSIKEFINTYSRIKINADTQISYKPYQWTLNEQ